MSYRPYQSHAGQTKGMSDSDLKLSRLSIPTDLSGKAVLDIGCNEGFFCGEAVKRGATRVVGVDSSVKALEIARELYPGPEFIRGSWQKLPDGPFDVILWTSAMHYELDPASVFNDIYRRLRPEGLLILECGAFNFSTKELVQVTRHSDTLWYPTIRLLTESFLSAFTARCLRFGDLTKGDPVPRYVFHCHKRKASVLIIRGSSMSGKSSLSELLVPAATKVISLDMLIARLASHEYHHTEIQKTIRDHVRQLKGLNAVYEAIDKAGLTDHFAAMIFEAVAPTDRLVVIEGVVSDALFEAIRLKLNGVATVWQAAC